MQCGQKFQLRVDLSPLCNYLSHFLQPLKDILSLCLFMISKHVHTLTVHVNIHKKSSILMVFQLYKREHSQYPGYIVLGAFYFPFLF